MSNELVSESTEIVEPLPLPEPQVAQGADEESEEPAAEPEEVDEADLSEDD